MRFGKIWLKWGWSDGVHVKLGKNSLCVSILVFLNLPSSRRCLSPDMIISALAAKAHSSILLSAWSSFTTFNFTLGSTILEFAAMACKISF